MASSPSPEKAEAAPAPAANEVDKPATNGHTSPSPATNGEAAEPAASPKKSEEKPKTPVADTESSAPAEVSAPAEKPNGSDTTAVPDGGEKKQTATPDPNPAKESADVDMKESEESAKAASPPSTTSPAKDEKEKDTANVDTASKKSPTPAAPSDAAEAAEPTSDKPAEASPTPAREASTTAADQEKPKALETNAGNAQDRDQDVEMTQAPSEDEAKESAKPNGVAAEKVSSPTQDDDVKAASLSQLAIDGQEEAAGDVAMADAPAAAPTATETSTKVSREREDDSIEEPAPKRAKTEPREDESTPQASIEASATEAAPDAQTADSITLSTATDNSPDILKQLPDWTNPEVNARPVTPFRVREYRRVLAGAKKTKAGGMFKDAVAKLWPTLAESYLAKVDRPMDLGLMERNLRDGKLFKTLSDVKDDLSLIYLNTYYFNGADHEVTVAGKAAVEQIWVKFIEIPEDEPPKAKAPPKHNPARHPEPRQAAHPPPPPRKESRPAAASPSTPAAGSSAASADADGKAYAVPPGGVPQVRRASTQNETDRPKRAIHPPKNRDIDYTAIQNFNKKKLPLDLQFGFDVVTELMDIKHQDINFAFLEPVDPVALMIPEYFNIVKKPMDLGTMKTKFVSGEYHNLHQVQQDIKLIVKNCHKFNGPDHYVTKAADTLGELASKEFSKKDQWLAKNAPSKNADAAGSGESEDESDDDDEGGPQASAAKGASSAALTSLEQRLADETATLTQMLLNVESADDTMIDVQRTVINAIRKRLKEEKEKTGSQQKPEKPAKGKSAKASGKKAGGTGGGRKSTGAAAPKKSGGAPKKKRVMTQVEKDAIANGINDLDENNIAKAIDIIKKDTGQSENDSGELELEIDQLTNEALHKLWDLLKKVLPGFGQNVRPPSPDETAVKAPKSSKPKKNKPMNAREQEARIAELERLKQSYQGPQDTGAEREPEMPVHPTHEEESSDSEEE